MSNSPIRPAEAGSFPQLTAGAHNVALGNGSQFKVWLFHVTDKRGEMVLFVGIPGEGCDTFDHPPHPDYVREKMGLMEGDAANLADFIACQFGNPPKGFGQYNPHLCN